MNDSAMNWPKSIGWVNGPIRDGRNERASVALVSLERIAFHAVGITRFTAAAARLITIRTPPIRAARTRCSSAQSICATAHPNSSPFEITKAPVRKMATGTCRSRALSSPHTMKPANHHCPGNVRSDCRATTRRRGIVIRHSTTSASSR